MSYRQFELRDDPDDLPIGPFSTLATARVRAKRRAERTCEPVLIYEVSDEGECFVCSVW
jgi:hypothetical protein